MLILGEGFIEDMGDALMNLTLKEPYLDSSLFSDNFFYKNVENFLLLIL